YLFRVLLIYVLFFRRIPGKGNYLDGRQAFEVLRCVREPPAARTGTHDQFPLALTAATLPVNGPLNSSFPERFRIAFSPKPRKQVVAVFTRVIRQGDPGKRRGGGKQVGRANGFIGERGLDGTRPACDKRNPMTPFVDIRLMTAVNVARV